MPPSNPSASHLPACLRAAASMLVTAATLLGARSASASSFTYLPVAELARVSDVTVLGRVASATTSWNAAHTMIVTTFLLEPEEVLAGTVVDGPVVIARPGGEAGGVAFGYDGMPELAVGERAVVFLRRRGAATFIVAGMFQGVLHEEGGRFVRHLGEVAGAPGSVESFTLDGLRAPILAGARLRGPSP